MKEEYIEEKLRQFDERLKKQKEFFTFLENELARIVATKEEYKDLVKRLKDVEEFKEDLKTTVRRENEELMERTIQTFKEDADREMKAAITAEVKRINQLAKHTEEQMQEVGGFTKKLDKSARTALYTEMTVEVLLEALINERVLSSEQADRIVKRAAIRAKKKEEE